MKSKNIPITAAKEIGKKYNKNQVIIITFDKDTETTTVTTWGKSLEDSEQAAIAGNAYKKGLGFPAEKCKDVPARVKKTKQKVPDILRPMMPSEALSAIVGPKPISRTEIVKKLWEYIKKNKLQDTKNRRMINADDRLRPIFKKEQVSMFDMAKILSKHISEVK